MGVVNRLVPWISLVLIWCLNSSCTEIGYKVVNSQEFAIVEKFRTGGYELIRRSELEELRKAAQVGKSVGRFQIFHSGLRTWRIDTATGGNCLLLASESDWKKPSVALQGCSDSAEAPPAKDDYEAVKKRLVEKYGGKTPTQTPSVPDDFVPDNSTPPQTPSSDIEERKRRLRGKWGKKEKDPWE